MFSGLAKLRGWSQIIIEEFDLKCSVYIVHSNVLAEDEQTMQDPLMSANKGLLKLKKIESCFNASLHGTMANFSDDLLGVLL